MTLVLFNLRGKAGRKKGHLPHFLLSLPLALAPFSSIDSQLPPLPPELLRSFSGSILAAPAPMLSISAKQAMSVYSSVYTSVY
jgi:hypothetical protein